MAEKALAFKMNVIAYTPNPKKDADFVEFVFSMSYGKVRHCYNTYPLTDATRGFIT